MDIGEGMGDIEIALGIFALGFSLSGLLSGLGLMMRCGMSFMKNVVAAVIGLGGGITLISIVLFFESSHILVLVAFACFTIALLIALASLLPKLMKTMQNANLYMYHIGNLLMAFMSCLALVVTGYL